MKHILTATDLSSPARQAADRAAGLAHAAGARMDGPSLVEAVFRNALRRWFGVLFWFLLLGPFGAVLYRLSVLAVERDDTQLAHETAAGARAWLALLEWPVAQLMTLGLALVGNFDSVMAAWREDDAFALHGDLLGACLLYTSPSPRDRTRSRMPSSA